MLYHGSSSQYPQVVKREVFNFSLHATPLAHDVGVGRRDSQFAEGQHRGLEYRPAYSIDNTNTTASSGASMMPQKRSSPSDSNGNGNGSSNGTTTKHVKIEHPEEFSNTVKKRLQSSTRTGQACDRCKVRKIRCDGLPGGCSPCLQNNTECRTTDRITGRAQSRGYVEGLEIQNRDLQNRLHELEQRLARGGIDAKSINGYNSVGALAYDYNAPPTASAWSPPATYTPQSSSSVTTGSQETNMFRALPAFSSGCFGDNYLGVSPGNSTLSSINGTRLTILGMVIDIADFTSEDIDEPDPSVFHPRLYNKSYQAFLQSVLNINPRLEKIDLPPREDGMRYTNWYFRVLNPYTPILHKPTFVALLTRMYDDPSFRPTNAETVMVHMVFAIMFFQYAARNWEDSEQQSQLNHQSNMHYHYSLSMFYQLSCSHTVQDVQALTMICMHLRNFPKPGASWILTQTTMSLAIELGLHRSVKRWASDAMPNPLDVEMRKRIFWAILAVHITLSGKLGRPMPFRLDDFDVEMPELVDDELLSENGLDTSRPGRCTHEIGIHAFSMIPLYIELYSTIYAVRRQPETYVSTISRLEAKLRAWKDGLPQGLMNGEAGANEQEGRVFALYAQVWSLEFRLLLRHPSVSMTKDAAFNAESMRICVEASRQMLGVVRQLQKYKSLDTTWYNSAVYVMAITTTLFAQWDKRGETSVGDLSALQEEMNLWLDIMGDVGALLGSGTRLREAVRNVTDGTLSLLSRSIPARASYSQGTKAIEKSKSPPHRSNSAGTYANNTPTYYETPSTNNGTSTSAVVYSPTEGQMAHNQTPYPAATQYPSYSETPSSSIAYTPDSANAYTAYPANSDAVAAPLLAAFAAQASQVHAQNQASDWQRSPHLADSGSLAWRQWTNTMTGTLEPRDCYSANALMQLGGRELSDTQSGSNSQASAALTAMAVNAQNGMDQNGGQIGGHLGGQVSGGMAWPLNIFDISQGGQSS